MQPPAIRSTLRDPRRRVDYHVIAYRPLTRAELIAAVRGYLAQARHRKPMPGDIVTIVTVIGAGD